MLNNVAQVVDGVLGFVPAVFAIKFGVVYGEVKVLRCFLLEFSNFFLFQRLARTIKQGTDGFEGFGPFALFNFLALEF